MLTERRYAFLTPMPTVRLAAPGAAVMMTTYSGTVTEVSTTTCPTDMTVSAASSADALAAIWEALDPSLRVAALAFDPQDLRGSLGLCG